MDGVLNNGQNKIVIIGATNRKEDIDPAILRRMHPQVLIGVPNTKQRQAIFQAILKDEPVDPEIDLSKLANETSGHSGSEIRDMCKMAFLNVLEEVVNKYKPPNYDDDLNLDQHSQKSSMLDTDSTNFDCGIEQ